MSAEAGIDLGTRQSFDGSDKFWSDFDFDVWSNMGMKTRRYPAAYQTEMQGHRQWWRINEVNGIFPEGAD